MEGGRVVGYERGGGCQKGPEQGFGVLHQSAKRIRRHDLPQGRQVRRAQGANAGRAEQGRRGPERGELRLPAGRDAGRVLPHASPLLAGRHEGGLQRVLRRGHRRGEEPQHRRLRRNARRQLSEIRLQARKAGATPARATEERPEELQGGSMPIPVTPQIEQFLHDNPQGVLTSFRRNGMPQLSIVTIYPRDGGVGVSITETRAKFKNLLRDPRCSILVSHVDWWSGFLVFEGRAELVHSGNADPETLRLARRHIFSATTRRRSADWDQYDRIAAADKRVTLVLRPDHIYGSALAKMRDAVAK